VKPYKVKKSKIDNLGLYASKNIKKGSKVIEYKGKVITRKEAEENPKYDNDKAIYLFNLNKRYDLDGDFKFNTARLINLESGGYRLDTDGVKLFATTAAKNIADRAIQVMGGYGYVGEYVVERLWRDSKLLEIGGGTLESHQKNMTKELFKNPDFIFK